MHVCIVLYFCKIVHSFLKHVYVTIMHVQYAFLEPVIELPPANPCVPSPCGPNALCQIHGENVPSCSCLPNYIGRPPNCRPECTINSECEGHLACQNHLCVDPCPGSCGLYATCVVVHHTPVCNCDQGYTGDPFSVCSPIIERKLFSSVEGRKGGFLFLPTRW